MNFSSSFSMHAHGTSDGAHALPKTTDEPAVVGVLEHDSDMSAFLGPVLSTAGYAQEYYDSVREIMAAILKNQISLAVFDCTEQEDDCIALVKRTRERSSVPLIVFGESISNPFHVKLLDEGADEVLARPIEPSLVRAKVDSLLRRADVTTGGRGGDYQALRIGPHMILDLSEQEIINDSGERLHLTEREFDILLVLAGSPKRVVDREVLFRDAIGVKWDPADRRVDLHVAHVRQKIAALLDGRILIRSVRGRGYKIEANVEPVR